MFLKPGPIYSSKVDVICILQQNIRLRFTDVLIIHRLGGRWIKYLYVFKNRSRKYSKGNKTVPGKVATTHTEDGHKEDI